MDLSLNLQYLFADSSLNINLARKSKMAESQRADWTITNIWYLALMTFGYIFGEIAHFLINTTSKEVARGKKHRFFLLLW